MELAPNAAAVGPGSLELHGATTVSQAGWPLSDAASMRTRSSWPLNAPVHAARASLATGGIPAGVAGASELMSTPVASRRGRQSAVLARPDGSARKGTRPRL